MLNLFRYRIFFKDIASIYRYQIASLVHGIPRKRFAHSNGKGGFLLLGYIRTTYAQPLLSTVARIYVGNSCSYTSSVLVL
jgi:hypothetical protein